MPVQAVQHGTVCPAADIPPVSAFRVCRNGTEQAA